LLTSDSTTSGTVDMASNRFSGIGHPKVGRMTRSPGLVLTTERTRSAQIRLGSDVAATRP
jgi:hypothetical protein